MNNGRLTATPPSLTPETFSAPGTAPSISGDGQRGGAGILWLLDPRAILRAYDASDLSRELYNSTQKPGDQLGSYVASSAPLVANGSVFVATKTSLTIFGLAE